MRARSFSALVFCRSPSWGAWIEIACFIEPSWEEIVAPPRGERGLKWLVICPSILLAAVAPPRGERGLKSLFHFLFFLSKRSLPLVGSVD